jgi:signal transduction histidine kinase
MNSENSRKNTRSHWVRSLFFRKDNVHEELAELEYLRKRVVFLENLMEEKNSCIEQAKSNFLKNLYHEIRTPLNAIIGFSDLIELNNIKGEEKDQYVQHIRESSRDFLRKMDNIIEASIIEAGLLKIEKEQCKLYELLSEIHAYFSLHKHITEKRIAFLMSVQKHLQKIEVMCDIYRITQVLTHLISNAFKYTPQGVVEFGCDIAEDEIKFFVKDTGIGGLKGKEEEVFKNFSKTGELSDEKEGLGLGLGLSKNIIEQMGGKIWYTSVVDKGTTFYFTIPFQPIYTKNTKENPKLKSDHLSTNHAYKRSVSSI